MSISHPESIKAAHNMAGMWSTFARTGHPGTKGQPEWPAYTAAADGLLEWGTPIAVRQRFRADQLDLLTAAMIERAR